MSECKTDHHDLVIAVMQNDDRKQACTCQFTDEDVEFVAGKASHVGEKDKNCPHRRQKILVDGRRIGQTAARNTQRRGL